MKRQVLGLSVKNWLIQAINNLHISEANCVCFPTFITGSKVIILTLFDVIFLTIINYWLESSIVIFFEAAKQE